MADSMDADLLDAVYSATTDEGTLIDVVKMYMSLQGDAGGALFHYDSIADRSSDLEVVTVDESNRDLVQSVFDSVIESNGALENPLITIGLEDLIAGKVLISDDVIPFDKFSQMEYYKAVFEPLGIRWSMGWVAAGRGQTWLTLTSSRTREAGAYKKKNIERAKLFQRHIARALHILELLDEADNTRRVFEQAVERVPSGIILVDDKLKVVFCNAQARRFLSNSSSLTSVRGQLRIGATAHERSVFDSWWSILVNSCVSDGACFSDLSQEDLWEVDVSRIGSDAGTNAGERRWMLTLKQYPDSGNIPIDYLIRRFGLTKSEANVCVFLCSAGDAVSTAKAMGVSPNTVRTHLKSAFRKTETRNQVELALLLTANK